MRKLVTFALLFGLSVLVDAFPAMACTCVGNSGFDEAARDSPVAVLARVVERGEKDGYTKTPRWIEADVEWVAKGDVGARRIRIWDGFPSSDCGGSLGPLKARSWAMIALRRVEDYLPHVGEYWKLADMSPGSGDFVIATGCAEGARILKTKEERERWIGRTIQ